VSIDTRGRACGRRITGIDRCGPDRRGRQPGAVAKRRIILPLLAHEREKQRLNVTARGGALGRRSAIFLQLEQRPVFRRHRVAALLSAELHEVASEEPLAVDLNEFEGAHEG
jgi:hypothetical protein